MWRQMKILNFQILFFGFTLLILSNVFAENSGEKLYQQHCSVCHGEPSAGKRRIAPPIFAVKNHYLAVHNEELTFVDAIYSWIANPEEEKQKRLIENVC